MDDQDKERTEFCCHRGLNEYNVMPFGLANAPGIFQQHMSIVLHNCESFALAYLDDIIIFSSNLEDHEKHIQQAFDHLRQHILKLKLSQCKFLQKQTQYLWFIISEDGIMADPGKVKVIKEMPPPTNVCEVRSFIGMCSYYRRFLPS